MSRTDFEDDYNTTVYLPGCPTCAHRYRAERELRLVELRSEIDTLRHLKTAVPSLAGLSERQRQVLRDAVIERAMRVDDQILAWESAPDDGGNPR